MFAERDEKEKAEKFATTAVGHVSAASFQGSLPPLIPISQPLPTTAPCNILSHWSWVDKDTIELIASGNFDIDGLPKLHRKDELRNAYIRKVVKGIYQPLTGGPSEIMIGTTKMQASFKDSTTFFSAWQRFIFLFVPPTNLNADLVWRIGQRGCSISFLSTIRGLPSSSTSLHTFKSIKTQRWLFDRACSKFDSTRLDSDRVEQGFLVREFESSRGDCSIENFEFESSRSACSIDVRLEMLEMLEKKSYT